MIGAEGVIGLALVTAAALAWSVGHALSIVASGLGAPAQGREGAAAPADGQAPPRLDLPAQSVEVVRARRTLFQPVPASPLRPGSAAEALRRRDPYFDEDAFLTRAKLVFESVKRGWSAQDMSKAACFVSAGFSERCAIQLAMRKAVGRRDDLRRFEIAFAALVAVESDARYDAGHVRVRAAAQGGGDVIDEVLTFLRRADARTKSAAELVAPGTCPNCGAKVLETDGGRCPSCGSWLDSGLFDWVLISERQSWAWTPGESERDVPGLGEARSADPELDARILEDRALVAFWRWQEAFWKGDFAALGVLCSDSCLAAVKAGFAGPGALGRDPDTIGLRLLSVADAGSRQRAEVLVQWTRDLETAPKQAVETLFAFERAAGSRTRPRCGLQSLRCPECGAPPAARDASRCPYCGAERRGSQAEWLLVEVDTRRTAGYS